MFVRTNSGLSVISAHLSRVISIKPVFFTLLCFRHFDKNKIINLETRLQKVLPNICHLLVSPHWQRPTCHTWDTWLLAPPWMASSSHLVDFNFICKFLYFKYKRQPPTLTYLVFSFLALPSVVDTDMCRWHCAVHSHQMQCGLFPSIYDPPSDWYFVIICWYWRYLKVFDSNFKGDLKAV